MKIEVTQFAFDCLAEIEAFGIIKGHSPEEAGNFVDDLLIRSTTAISQNPRMFHYSPRLVDFGLKMRERLDETSHWCLYEVAGDTVFIMLYVHTRQDLVRALYRHHIIRS